ncbi:hypothetical protein H6P81_018366 [Aristolochia fimbriata]|uniref:Pentatricopeptide repeat-containing protein n=1 Tax=Aristolochia fimbriata TaxID=158543 RepID=A0AAV7E520_ARIFI|nr:hypothetical protein H6P81_018366 [Aristolochia fimbriata]
MAWGVSIFTMRYSSDESCQKLRMILLLLPKGYSTISRSHICYLKWPSLFRPASCQNFGVPYKFSWFAPFATLVNSRAVEPTCHGQIIPLKDSPVNSFVNLESVNIIEILKRLSKNPNAALSFFNDTKNRRCFPDVDSYTTMIQILCSSKLHVKLKFFLGEMELERFGLSPNIYSFTILFKFLVKENKQDEVKNVFQQMQQLDIKPDIFIYTTLMKGMCSIGKSSCAYELLQEIRGSGIQVGTVSYNVVIRGFCCEMRLSEAEDVLEDMRKQGIVADTFSYSYIIHGHCKSGDFSRALSYYDKFVSEDCGLLPDKVLYSIVIHAHCKLKNMRKVNELFNKMKDQGLVPDVIHYTTVMNGYFHLGELSGGLAFFSSMLKIGITPDIVTYKSLADLYLRKGYRQEIFHLLENLNYMLECGLSSSPKKETQVLSHSSANGVKLLNPYSVVYGTVIEGFCQGGKGIRPDVVTYTVLLNALFKESFYYSSAHGNTKPIDSEEFRAMSFDLLTEMIEMEVELDVSCYTVLIDGHFKMDCVDDAEYLFHCMTNRGLKPDVIAYSALLAGYCWHGNVAKAQNLVNKLRAGGIMDDHTLSLLEQRFMKAKQMGIRHKVCVRKHFELYAVLWWVWLCALEAVKDEGADLAKGVRCLVTLGC